MKRYSILFITLVTQYICATAAPADVTEPPKNAELTEAPEHVAPTEPQEPVEPIKALTIAPTEAEGRSSFSISESSSTVVPSRAPGLLGFFEAIVGNIVGFLHAILNIIGKLGPLTLPFQPWLFIISTIVNFLNKLLNPTTIQYTTIS